MSHNQGQDKTLYFYFGKVVTKFYFKMDNIRVT